MASPSFTVLVPLYIYPLEKAWEPLFRSALAHPQVRFLAVINPGNGPGSTPMPDASYAAAMREMGSIPNIQPIGYVYCSYGRRAIDEVQKDIDLYRGWNARFKMDGIFVDEAPSDPDHLEYMAGIAQYANSTWQTNLGRRSINVYNPGVVADPAYFEVADYIVAFEQSEEHWNLEPIRQSLSLLSQPHCSKSLAIIHSCRPLAADGLRQLLGQVKSMGLAGAYLTDQLGGGFTRWPEEWDRFLSVADDRC
jgi:hypothetical protein